MFLQSKNFQGSCRLFCAAMRSNHSDLMFRGLIDEVRIFGNKVDGSRALSLDEIQTIYTF